MTAIPIRAVNYRAKAEALRVLAGRLAIEPAHTDALLTAADWDRLATQAEAALNKPR